VQPTKTELDARTRLREAALELFGRNGIHSTSTREIIAAAGLRNPSAINYYFGSKSDLIEDIGREVLREESAIVRQHIALVVDGKAPSPVEWAAAAVDAANTLLATERGCLLVRVWSERDDMTPDAVEEFLGSAHPLAREWRAAVRATFPGVDPVIAISRNLVVLRTLQWITVRRARRLLSGEPGPWRIDPESTRPFLIELSLNILTPPTTVSGADIQSLRDNPPAS
jgi:AcrR family transcriptional regulator